MQGCYLYLIKYLMVSDFYCQFYAYSYLCVMFKECKYSTASNICDIYTLAWSYSNNNKILLLGFHIFSIEKINHLLVNNPELNKSIDS